MTMTTSQLSFPVLFERAIARWPESLELPQVFTSDAHPQLYTVTGLGELTDTIVGPLDREADAILMVSLHDAIEATLRTVAKFCTRIDCASVRPEAVQEDFESRLRRAVENPDLGWTENDALLVRKYLEANRP